MRLKGIPHREGYPLLPPRLYTLEYRSMCIYIPSLDLLFWQQYTHRMVWRFLAAQPNAVIDPPHREGGYRDDSDKVAELLFRSMVYAQKES